MDELLKIYDDIMDNLDGLLFMILLFSPVLAFTVCMFIFG